MWGRADLYGTVPRASLEDLDIFDVQYEKIGLFARKGILVIEKGAGQLDQIVSQLKMDPNDLKVCGVEVLIIF